MGERELIFVIYIFIRNRIYNISFTPARVCSGMQEIISAKRKKQMRKHKRSPLYSTFETSGREATYEQLKLLEDFRLFTSPCFWRIFPPIIH